MGMKKVCLGLSVAALATIANANLITNGSFEDPDVGGGWGLFTTIPGWTAVGTFPIEIGHASVYGVTNNHLDQVMEMDSTGNSIVQQILGTSTGTSYDLAFGVARRSGVSATDCRVEVYWNGGLLTTIDPSSTVMAYYSFNVLGGVSGSTLEFRGGGTQNSLGGLVDDVILVASDPQSVPEPFTMALMGGAAIAGYRRVRRKRA
jgi:hypothetical protein